MRSGPGPLLLRAEQTPP